MNRPFARRSILSATRLVSLASFTALAACGAEGTAEPTGTQGAALGPSGAVINEVKANPPGTDGPYEYVELAGAGTLPAHTFVLSVDGDSGAVGRINYALDVGGKSFGANGLLLIAAPGSYAPPAVTTRVDDPALTGSNGKIGNGSESILLVTFSSAPSISVGTTLYPSLSGVTVLDAVGWQDNGAGTVYGGVSLPASSPPDAVSRFAGAISALDAGSFYWGELDGTQSGDTNAFDPAKVGPNFPAGGALTPGAPNLGTLGADAGVADSGGAVDATWDGGSAVDATSDGGGAVDATWDGGGAVDATWDSGPSDDASTGDGGPSGYALLNEVKVNPPGNDGPYEYIELLGWGQVPSDTWVLSVDGDGTSVGRINYALNLGGKSFGTNGLIFVSAPGSYSTPAETTRVDDTALTGSNGKIGNGSESVLLVQLPAGTAITPGTTLYTSLSGVTVLDAVGWEDSGSGTVFGGAPLGNTGGAPDGVVRFVGDETPISSAAWYWGELQATTSPEVAFDPSKVSADFPAGGVMTPGEPNAGVVATDGGASFDSGVWDGGGADGGVGGDAGWFDSGSAPDAAADASGSPDSSVADSGPAPDAGTKDAGGNQDGAVLDSGPLPEASTDAGGNPGDDAGTPADAGRPSSSSRATDDGSSSDGGCSTGGRAPRGGTGALGLGLAALAALRLRRRR